MKGLYPSLKTVQKNGRILVLGILYGAQLYLYLKAPIFQERTPLADNPLVKSWIQKSARVDSEFRTATIVLTYPGKLQMEEIIF